VNDDAANSQLVQMGVPWLRGEEPDAAARPRREGRGPRSASRQPCRTEQASAALRGSSTGRGGTLPIGADAIRVWPRLSPNPRRRDHARACQRSFACLSAALCSSWPWQSSNRACGSLVPGRSARAFSARDSCHLWCFLSHLGYQRRVLAGNQMNHELVQVVSL